MEIGLESFPDETKTYVNQVIRLKLFLNEAKTYSDQSIGLIFFPNAAESGRGLFETRGPRPGEKRIYLIINYLF